MHEWTEINYDKRRGWVCNLNRSVQILVEDMHHDKYKASLLVLDQTMLYSPNTTVMSKQIEDGVHMIQMEAVTAAARSLIPKLKNRYAAIKSIRDFAQHQLKQADFITVAPETTWLCHVNPMDSIILTRHTNKLYEVKYMNAFDGVIVSRTLKLKKKDKTLPLGQIMDKAITEFANNTLDYVLQNITVITKLLEAIN